MVDTNLLSYDWQSLTDAAGDLAIETAKAHGKGVAQAAIDALKAQWRKVDWAGSEKKYRTNLLDAVNTTKVLGNPKAINI